MKKLDFKHLETVFKHALDNDFISKIGSADFAMIAAEYYRITGKELKKNCPSCVLRGVKIVGAKYFTKGRK